MIEASAIRAMVQSPVEHALFVIDHIIHEKLAQFPLVTGVGVWIQVTPDQAQEVEQRLHEAGYVCTMLIRPTETYVSISWHTKLRTLRADPNQPT